VNLASRIEGLTKEFSVDILASEDTLRAAGADFRVRAMPEVKVKGKSAPVRTFALEALPGGDRTGAGVMQTVTK
jgi:adenylate cyclase